MKQAFLSFSYDFMFDRIICFLVRIMVRGHLMMSIIQLMNLISMHFWTFLLKPGQGWQPWRPLVTGVGPYPTLNPGHILRSVFPRNFCQWVQSPNKQYYFLKSVFYQLMAVKLKGKIKEVQLPHKPIGRLSVNGQLTDLWGSCSSILPKLAQCVS